MACTRRAMLTVDVAGEVLCNPATFRVGTTTESLVVELCSATGHLSYLQSSQAVAVADLLRARDAVVARVLIPRLQEELNAMGPQEFDAWCRRAR